MKRKGGVGARPTRRPEGKVIPQKLHDQSGILVTLLAEGIQLGDGVVEGLFGEMAGPIRTVLDLVVEHREVEGESQPDRVGGCEVGLGDLGSLLVGFVGCVRGGLFGVGLGEFGEVTVVVSLPVSAGRQQDCRFLVKGEIRPRSEERRNWDQTYILW